MNPIFIKAAEKNFETISLIVQVKNRIENGIIQLFDTKGTIQFEEIISLNPGKYVQNISATNGVNLMFAQVLVDGEPCSNKQFVIDINAFERTNPSPRNRSLNQIKKLIESGDFSTPKIIDYLNTIYRQKEAKKGISKTGIPKEDNDDFPIEKDDDLIYLSYEEIQKRTKLIDDQEKTHLYVEYKGVRLWEIIFSYLKDSREKNLQTKIDEEETEDINSSEGRSTKNEFKTKRTVSKSTFKRLEDKVRKFLDSYYNILLQKTTDPKSEQPTLIDLSMYLIMMEILLHLIGHKERITEEDEEKHLLKIPFSKNALSWSEELLQYIGMFTMWCTQKQGFKDIDSENYRIKLEHYKTMAFKTNLSALSICRMVNEKSGIMDLSQWNKLSLLNSNLVFNPANFNHTETEGFISFIPQKVLDDLGEALIEDEISNNLTLLKSLKINSGDLSVGDIYFHPQIGYTCLAKVIKSSTDTFYKLFTPGFEWDDKVNDFWNGQLYSINEKKWLKSIKHGAR